RFPGRGHKFRGPARLSPPGRADSLPPMDLTNIGIGFVPFETRNAVVARLAIQADEAGLASVGVAEGWTYDSTILLAELAQKTARIGLGASVLSVWGRSPATIALAATGLQRCSGGRFTLRLGGGRSAAGAAPRRGPRACPASRGSVRSRACATR